MLFSTLLKSVSFQFGYNNWLALNPSVVSPLDCVQLLSDGIVGLPLGQGGWVTTPCISIVGRYICKVPL